jgi:hypothetical protein
MYLKNVDESHKIQGAEKGNDGKWEMIIMNARCAHKSAACRVIAREDWIAAAVARPPRLLTITKTGA